MEDGEDVFTNIIIILTGANVVKTDCLHEMYTAAANAAVVRRTSGILQQWRLH